MIAPLRRRRIVFAGGGTGGHLFPALAVARALPSCEPLFLVPRDRGDPERLRGEFPTLVLDCPRPDRGPLLYLPRLLGAVRRARRMLRDADAAAVVGLGGYAALPASLAARTLGLPLYLMECNAVPGRATRLLARFASGIGLGEPAALDHLRDRARCRVTGTPLRSELRDEAEPGAFGLARGRPTLLVVGGSQGARGLNTRVVDGVRASADLGFQVLHCAGKADAERVRALYRGLPVPAAVVDFLPDIGRAYAVADLVLARAGASTVAECLALGKPAVFVPYPWHRDRQQARNAGAAVGAGAAVLVEEEALTPEAFRGLVRGLLLDGAERARMGERAAALARPDAARAMAAHLVESLGEAVGERGACVEIGG